MLDVEQLKAVVFDCDGVLLDTVRLKLEAFREWVPEEYEMYRAQFAEYNIRAFGKTRKEQITYFYEDIMGVSVAGDELAFQIQRFAEIVQQKIAKATWLEGSAEFLEYCHGQGILVFILSGAPSEELISTFEKLDCMHMFDGVYGAPTTKQQGMADIINKYGLQPSDMVFVGDADKDYFTAEEFGVRFIYKPSEVIVSSWKPFLEEEDLSKLIAKGKQ